jgi:hypothetical protein
VADGLLASSSAYPVQTQQDTLSPSLYQFNSNHFSCSWLFLNWAGVLRHICSSKACFAADLSFTEIHVDARAGNVMAGAGGAPVRLVLHLTYVTR